MHYPPHYRPVSLDSYMQLSPEYEAATITIKRYDDFRFWQRWEIQIFRKHRLEWRHAIDGTRINCEDYWVDCLIVAKREREECAKMAESFIEAIASYGDKIPTTKEQTY